jgi:hypothetical protein
MPSAIEWQRYLDEQAAGVRDMAARRRNALLNVLMADRSRKLRNQDQIAAEERAQAAAMARMQESDSIADENAIAAEQRRQDALKEEREYDARLDREERERRRKMARDQIDPVLWSETYPGKSPDDATEGELLNVIQMEKERNAKALTRESWERQDAKENQERLRQAEVVHGKLIASGALPPDNSLQEWVDKDTGEVELEDLMVMMDSAQGENKEKYFELTDKKITGLQGELSQLFVPSPEAVLTKIEASPLLMDKKMRSEFDKLKTAVGPDGQPYGMDGLIENARKIPGFEAAWRNAANEVAAELQENPPERARYLAKEIDQLRSSYNEMGRRYSDQQVNYETRRDTSAIQPPTGGGGSEPETLLTADEINGQPSPDAVAAHAGYGAGVPQPAPAPQPQASADPPPAAAAIQRRATPTPGDMVTQSVGGALDYLFGSGAERRREEAQTQRQALALERERRARRAVAPAPTGPTQVPQFNAVVPQFQYNPRYPELLASNPDGMTEEERILLANSQANNALVPQLY